MKYITNTYMTWVKEFLVPHRTLALSWLCITILTGCGPTHLRSPFAPPTPTPPAGFFNVESLVPGQRLRSPSLNADGKMLAAFGSVIAETTIARLYVFDLENKQLVFTGNEQIWTSLALSPDGKMIAAQGYGQSGEGIYLIDWQHNVLSYLNDGSWPVWNSNGRQIAFMRMHSLAGTRSSERQLQISIHDLETAEETIIFDMLSPSYGYFHQLTWTSEEDKFAFVMAPEISIVNGNNVFEEDLYVYLADGKELHKLTHAQKPSVSSPNLSHDGDSILYLDHVAPLDPYGTYLQVVNLEGDCHRLEPPAPGIRGVNLSAHGNVIALYTQYGLLVANTETVMGEDFWIIGTPCT